MKKPTSPARFIVPEFASKKLDRVSIRKLPTGVRGLDDILGGGIPERSFNIIAGTPGCGKTTLAHQIAFANATPRKPALYFTVLGEPALKMLRYQQQYSFFDESRLGRTIRFINLSDGMLEKDLDKGVVITHPRRTDYEGLVTGIPHRTGPRQEQKEEAAPEPKATG